MKIKAVYFTDKGKKIAEKLQNSGFDVNATNGTNGEFKRFVEQNFIGGEKLVFIGAVGIAVRAIAKHIKSKDKDPAVVVVDDTGKFAIPILSGHIGGANLLAKEIAEKIGAVAVISTATDNSNVFAIDDFAARAGLSVLNIEKIKTVSGALLKGQTVGVSVDGITYSCLPDGLEISNDADIYFGPFVKKGEDKLHIVAPCCVLGVGCKRGTKKEDIEKLFEVVCEEIAEKAFFAVCTIDLKKDEKGLIEFCEEHGFSFNTYSAEQLNEVQGEFSASEFVLGVTGVDNVCERSAKALAGNIIVRKISKNGVTMAVSLIDREVDFNL